MGNFVIGKCSPQLFFHFLHTTASRCCARLETVSTFHRPRPRFQNHAWPGQCDSRFVAPVWPVHSYKPPCRNEWRHTFPALAGLFNSVHAHRMSRLNTVKCVCNCGSSARELSMHECRGHQIAGHTVTIFNALLAMRVAATSFEFHETRPWPLPHCASINRWSSSVTASTETDFGAEQVKS